LAIAAPNREILLFLIPTRRKACDRPAGRRKSPPLFVPPLPAYFAEPKSIRRSGIGDQKSGIRGDSVSGGGASSADHH
jgi:hypothetical protein